MRRASAEYSIECLGLGRFANPRWRLNTRTRSTITRPPRKAPALQASARGKGTKSKGHISSGNNNWDIAIVMVFCGIITAADGLYF